MIDVGCPARLFAFDLPLEPGVSTPGFWAAAINAAPHCNWTGATLFHSPKPTDGYRPHEELTTQAVVGWLERPPGRGVWRDGEADDSRAIFARVPVDSIEFESVDETSFEAGRNTFLIGSEVIQVRRWTLTDADEETWLFRGTGLRRGLFGTGINGTGHFVGAPVIWLDGGGVEFINCPQRTLDADGWWKAAPPGFDLWEVPAVKLARIPRSEGLRGRLALEAARARHRIRQPRRA